MTSPRLNLFKMIVEKTKADPDFVNRAFAEDDRAEKERCRCGLDR